MQSEFETWFGSWTPEPDVDGDFIARECMGLFESYPIEARRIASAAWNAAIDASKVRARAMLGHPRPQSEDAAAVDEGLERLREKPE